MPALEILKNEGFKFKLDIIEGIPYDECVERKKKASIFIDQISETGFYGNSSLEAMQYGIPTICYISEQAAKQSNDKITKNCPVINPGNTIESVASKFRHILKSDLTEIAKQTKKFTDEFHSYEVVGKMWREIYVKTFSEYNSKI